MENSELAWNGVHQYNMIVSVSCVHVCSPVIPAWVLFSVAFVVVARSKQVPQQFGLWRCAEEIGGHLVVEGEVSTSRSTQFLSFCFNDVLKAVVCYAMPLSGTLMIRVPDSGSPQVVLCQLESLYSFHMFYHVLSVHVLYTCLLSIMFSWNEPKKCFLYSNGSHRGNWRHQDMGISIRVASPKLIMEEAPESLNLRTQTSLE